MTTTIFQRRFSSAASAARILALIVAAFAFLALPVVANDAHAAPAVAGEHAEHHALTNDAPVLFKLFGLLPVNNSMVITWTVALLIIFFARYATKSIRSTADAAAHTPAGAQNFWEFLVEGLHNFLGEIIGHHLVKKTFWFFATIFIFILFTNWFGLLPGVGTIGYGHYDAAGLFHLTRPVLRGGNADLNMTAAMALTFFAWWLVWAVLENRHGKTGVVGIATGIWGVIKHLFAPKGKETGFMKWFMIVIFFAVGILELISIAFRPVSLSFRLYGNIFAGENLLESMANLIPAIGGFLPIPFYFMELLVGLVQALVFMMLTAVFTLLICSHGDDHGHEEEKAHH